MPNTDPTSGYNTGSATLAYPGVFTGITNNGDVSLGSEEGLIPNKFYAVGNPYPSTLSANSLINGNATGGTLYFRRKRNAGLGSAYATYNLVGPTVTAEVSGNGSEIPNEIIQVGQDIILKYNLTGAEIDLKAGDYTFTSAVSSCVYKSKKVYKSILN